VTAGRRKIERTDAARKSKGNPNAYNEYVQGRRHLDAFRTREDAEKARAHFEKAVVHDADSVLAHEALAELY
jgi:Tfp pilus assembly protein PilF